MRSASTARPSTRSPRCRSCCRSAWSWARLSAPRRRRQPPRSAGPISDISESAPSATPASSNSSMARLTTATSSAKRDKAASALAPAALCYPADGGTRPEPGVFQLLRGAQRVGVAIDLQPGDPEARDAVAVDRPLPGEKFLDRQIVPPAGFLQAQRAIADCGDDNRLAPHHPTFGVGRGQLDGGG